jgi:protein-disulfide isomerase
MPRLTVPFLALACALAVSACGRSDAGFDNKVHAYLVAHPEVIQDAMDALQKKQEAVQAKQEADAEALTQKAIGPNRQAIERDPHDYVANPNGKITVTEFYDYRCPHCANIAPAVLSIIHDNPDVRVVFKEYVIFHEASRRGAIAALEVKRAGGDYLGLYHDLMSTESLDEATVAKLVKAHGGDPSKLEAEFQAPDFSAQIDSVQKLATTLGLQGTPAFIVGNTLISGENTAGLKAAIAAARAGK